MFKQVFKTIGLLGFIVVINIICVFCVTGKEASANKTTGNILENDYIRVVVEPRWGGRIMSFVVKSNNKENTIWKGTVGGFGADIFPANVYPGLLRDISYNVELVKAGKSILLRCKLSNSDYSGLVFEKEYSISKNSSSLNVITKVKNTSSGTKKVSLRVQNCIMSQKSIYTWPTDGLIRICQNNPELGTSPISVNSLDKGWIGYVKPDSKNGLIFLFDSKQTTKAYSHFSNNLNTIEWYYHAIEIPPGGSWQTSYAIVPVLGAAPVVSASKDLVIGLEPLRLKVNKDYSLSILSLANIRSVKVTAEGLSVNNKTFSISKNVKLTKISPSLVKLPWRDKKIKRIRLTLNTTEGNQQINISNIIRSKELSLPKPPGKFASYTAAKTFFPFGDYIRCCRCAVAVIGDEKDFVSRNLRIYRRNYLNTVITGDLTFPPYRFEEFKSGVSWIGELARKYDMQMIPKLEILRGRGDKINVTKKEMLEYWRTTRGWDIDVMKKMFARYSDNIIAHDLSDEPKAKWIRDYMTGVEIFKDIDPKNPALPLINLTETQYLPYVPVYYCDQYATHYAPSNPWRVGTAVQKIAKKTQIPIWCMLQAFGSPNKHPEWSDWRIPTAAEIRLMTYGVIANGGKGIMYHGTYSPPCWRYNSHYFHIPIDSWGVATDNWKAVGQAAKYLTAIGPSLLETDFTTSAGIDCEQIGSYKSFYVGPAITAGILKQRNKLGSFLVVTNQDIENMQKGTLRINPKKSNNKLLFDLYDLISAPKSGKINQAVNLIPGDGRIFYYGPAGEGMKIRAAVHGQHYQNEKAIYSIDADLAKVNGVDISDAVKLEKEAAVAYKKGNYIESHQKILEAQKIIAVKIEQDKTLSSCLNNLQKSLDMLSEIARTFLQNIDIVIPEKLRKNTKKRHIWNNTEDSQMQSYADDTAECFKKLILLEYRVYKGEAKTIVKDADNLLQTVKNLHSKAIPYVLSKK